MKVFRKAGLTRSALLFLLLGAALCGCHNSTAVQPSGTIPRAQDKNYQSIRNMLLQQQAEYQKSHPGQTVPGITIPPAN